MSNLKKLDQMFKLQIPVDIPVNAIKQTPLMMFCYQQDKDAIE